MAKHCPGCGKDVEDVRCELHERCEMCRTAALFIDLIEALKKALAAKPEPQEVGKDK